MIIRSGIFVIGIVIGISTMLVLDRPVASSSVAIQKVESSEPKAVAPFVKTETDEEPVDNGSTSEEIAPPGNPSLVDDPIRIPSAYGALVGPVPPPRLSTAEIHALFEKEPRDEPWAFAMEAGIHEHIANFGAGKGTVVEYVECRSQYCEIAGYADKGQSADTGFYLAMTESGWWQASGGSHHVSGRRDGIDRFVMIFLRYREE